MNAIAKVFNDAYKLPLSVILIDSIERLLEFVPIGPRFSNGVLQTLLVLLKKNPPKDKKLLVLSTTTHRGLVDQMDMADAFDAELHVSNITTLEAIEVVVKANHLIFMI